MAGATEGPGDGAPLIVTSTAWPAGCWPLGLAVWPLVRSLAEQLDTAVRAALGAEADARERAAGAAAGPWVTWESVLAEITGDLPEARLGAAPVV